MTTTATGLARLDEAQRLLASIHTPRDAKSAIAAFDVLKLVAKELGLSLHEQNQIAEGRLRAQRRGGEVIPTTGVHPGRNWGNSSTLEELGIEPHESHRWQAIAGLPGDVFESYIATGLANDDELTTAGLLKLVPKLPKPVPDPDSVSLEGPLLRFSQVDLPTATIVALVLRVAFPDAETALDTTYGSGSFWDGSAHVSVTAHDGLAERAPNGVADFTCLPYNDTTFDVVVFDPPHIADAGAESIMGQRFGTYASAELETVIRAGTREAWRVARLGVVVRVTDHTHSERFVHETRWVADELGEPYDVVHQVRSGALIDPKWDEQRHAYNNGSTYLIFRREARPHDGRA